MFYLSSVHHPSYNSNASKESVCFLFSRHSLSAGHRTTDLIDSSLRRKGEKKQRCCDSRVTCQLALFLDQSRCLVLFDVINVVLYPAKFLYPSLIRVSPDEPWWITPATARDGKLVRQSLLLIYFFLSKVVFIFLCQRLCLSRQSPPKAIKPFVCHTADLPCEMLCKSKRSFFTQSPRAFFVTLETWWHFSQIGRTGIEMQ